MSKSSITNISAKSDVRLQTPLGTPLGVCLGPSGSFSSPLPASCWSRPAHRLWPEVVYKHSNERSTSSINQVICISARYDEVGSWGLRSVRSRQRQRSCWQQHWLLRAISI